MSSNTDFPISMHAADRSSTDGNESSPPPMAANDRETLAPQPERSGFKGLQAKQSIEVILGPVQRWIGDGYAGLYLYEEESKALRLHMLDAHLVQEIAPQGIVPVEGTTAGQVFRRQEVAVFDHAGLASMVPGSMQCWPLPGVRSLCLVPIVTDDGPLGVLEVASRQARAFTESDLELLRRAAATAVAILDSAADHGTSLREQEQIRSLLNISRILASSGTGGEGLLRSFVLVTDRLFQTEAVPRQSPPRAQDVAEHLLTEFFGASGAGLCILDRDLRYVAINPTLAEINGVPAAVHLGKTVRDVLGSFADVVEAPLLRVRDAGEPVFNFEIKSVLPGSTEPGHWINHYFPIQDAAGRVTQIGVVVNDISEQRRAQASLRGLTQELQAGKKRLQALLEVSQVLAANREIQHTFPRISAILRRILRQEYASFVLYDEKNNLFVGQAVDFPLGKGLFHESPIVSRNSPQGLAMTEQRPLIFAQNDLAGLTAGSSLEQVGQNFLAEGLRSWCCIPLLRPKGPVGVLSLASTRENAFHAEDFALLTQVASQLGVALENARTRREVEELKGKLAEETLYPASHFPATIHFEEIVGNSPVLKQVLEQVVVVATSEATVLILGETGTGKELIARAIHRLSPRRERNFVKVNCAAIPTGLLESELFGHEKGAFTGAVSQKIGRMELADHGTLFLDEIGEIPLELQPKLLRVLQDHEFERLGGTKTIKVRLRLVAATNRDLAKSVLAHEFRSDLFYRLNVFPIRMPSLHERSDDIPLLVSHFVRKHAARMDRRIETIPSEAMKAMVNHPWPGNVRELENFIERSVILSESTVLRVPLSELILGGIESGSDRTLENAEREHIIQILRETQGVISGPGGAAHKLGLKRTTLQSMMQRLKISREDYAGPGQAGRRAGETPS